MKELEIRLEESEQYSISIILKFMESFRILMKIFWKWLKELGAL